MTPYIPADDQLSMKLFTVLTRAYQAVRRRVEQQIRTMGLNPTEFAVLEFLYSSGDSPVQKIGEKVLITSGSITYVVDKLEKKNLVERKTCPHDRRVTFIALTDAGTMVMDTALPHHAEELTAICNGLDTNEKNYLIEALKKLGIYAEGVKPSLGDKS